MESEAGLTGTVRDPASSAADAVWAGRLALVRLGLVGGGLLSMVGFALPWFRVNRTYLWWYGGWDLLTTNVPDLAWIALIFLGYALIVLAGCFLARFGLTATVFLAAAAIGVASSTLIVVALAAADAVNGQGRVYSLEFTISLVLMVAGHGAMIAAAIAAIVVQAIRAALHDLATLNRD